MSLQPIRVAVSNRRGEQLRPRLFDVGYGDPSAPPMDRTLGASACGQNDTRPRVSRASQSLCSPTPEPTFHFSIYRHVPGRQPAPNGAPFNSLANMPPMCSVRRDHLGTIVASFDAGPGAALRYCDGLSTI